MAQQVVNDLDRQADPERGVAAVMVLVVEPAVKPAAALGL